MLHLHVELPSILLKKSIFMCSSIFMFTNSANATDLSSFLSLPLNVNWAWLNGWNGDGSGTCRTSSTTKHLQPWPCHLSRNIRDTFLGVTCRALLSPGHRSQFKLPLWLLEQKWKILHMLWRTVSWYHLQHNYASQNTVLYRKLNYPLHGHQFSNDTGILPAVG